MAIEVSRAMARLLGRTTGFSSEPVIVTGTITEKSCGLFTLVVSSRS